MKALGLVCIALLAACGGKKDDKQTGGGTGAEPKTVDPGKSPEPSPGGGERKVVKIAAGRSFACAVMDDGGVRCWGSNSRGNLGTAKSDDDATTPVQVPGVTNVTDIVLGGDSGSSGDIACAITKDKEVWCWGGPQMIPGNTGNKSEPRAIGELKGIVSLALGGGNGFAVKPDGTVWGWGSSAFNTMNDGTQGSGPNKPLHALPGIANAKQVVAGQNHGCALLGDGTVTCWGYSGKKQTATPVAGLTGVTALFVEAGREETCAQTPAATLCWGASQEPKALEGLTGVKKIAGLNHMCALAGDGSVWCWGDNNFGQLGSAPGDSKYKPTKVEGLAKKAIDIAVGHVFTCAALEDGSAACWGYNQRGQLGDGTLVDHHAPAAVVGLGAATLAAAKDGLDKVGEGPTPTSWEGMPAACKNGPIEVKTKAWSGTLTPKGARAQSQLGGKTIAIELADHALHASWGEPRGKQGKLSVRLARFEIKGDKRTPLAVDKGEYKLGTKEERVVSPSFQTKLGQTSLVAISLDGIDAGKLAVTHLDDKWICGDLALAAGDASVKGPFAAPIK